MTPVLETLVAPQGWPSFMFGVAWKAGLVLLSALAITRVLSRAAASTRHRVWTMAFAAVLALPFLTGSIPAWRVAVPGWSVDAPATPSDTGPAGADADSPRGSALAATADAPTGRPGGDRTTGVRQADNRPAAAGATSPWPLPVSVGGILSIVWGLGAALLVARLATGIASAWWTGRVAVPVTDRGWRRSVEGVAREMGIRPPRVRRSPWVGTPMAWGILRPMLLLPPDAEEWPADRRRAVVLHEMAHIKRRDCLVHLLAQAVRAVHWPNPLAWVGARRLRTERERACDDLVLASGTRSADYAKLLLDVARARGDRRLGRATVSMAQPSELEGRLLAILDPALNRRGVGRPWSLATLVVVGALVVPLAAFRAVPSPAPATDAANAAIPPTGRAGGPPPMANAAGGETAAHGEARAEARAGSRTKTRDERPAQATVRSSEPAARDTLDPRVRAAMDRALRSDHAEIRAEAAHTLGMSESADAVPLLIPLLADASAHVRSEAAWALGMIEDVVGVSALVNALDDEDAQVRSQAAWALGMIESADAVPGLGGALSDESAQVRSQAAWALGMIEDAGAVDALIRALGSDDSSQVRSQAAWALGMIEDERAVDALIDAIEDVDEDVASQAMWALGQVIG